MATSPHASHDLQTRLQRLPFLLLAMGALLAALWAGLVRLGWNWPALQPSLPMAHGPLMIGGFLGALIGLERAVGLERRWAYSSPLLCGGGALLFVIGAPGFWGALLITLGSVILVAATIQILRIQPALYTGVIALGSSAWLMGNLFWLSGWLVPQVVFWWAGFLILTIVGERLELSRILSPSSGVQLLFLAGVVLLLAGLLLTLVNYAAGVQLAGFGLMILALWLWRYDIARRRVKAGGQARFIALCLLSGYLWLGVGGLLALLYGGDLAGPHYDALLHTLFLGFVFAMIFGHALIIFPAILKITMAYTPRLYSHLLLLHVTLALRVVGDLWLWWPGRLWGGLLNVLVLLLFLANSISSVRRSSTYTNLQSMP
ncbi:MAG: hypothetical protein R3C14_14375 [Caldilineaceae bacterium]